VAGTAEPELRIKQRLGLAALATSRDLGPPLSQEERTVIGDCKVVKQQF
jgi:hypothetical protein